MVDQDKDNGLSHIFGYFVIKCIVKALQFSLSLHVFMIVPVFFGVLNALMYVIKYCSIFLHLIGRCFFFGDRVILIFFFFIEVLIYSVM